MRVVISMRRLRSCRVLIVMRCSCLMWLLSRIMLRCLRLRVLLMILFGFRLGVSRFVRVVPVG